MRSTRQQKHGPRIHVLYVLCEMTASSRTSRLYFLAFLTLEPGLNARDIFATVFVTDQDKIGASGEILLHLVREPWNRDPKQWSADPHQNASHPSQPQFRGTLPPLEPARRRRPPLL
jgi:hypothetical protein